MGRARLARQKGVTRVNQWLNPLKRGTGSNLVDMGRATVRGARGWTTGPTPKPGIDAGGEVTVKACGVAVDEAVAEELGADPDQPRHSERGNRPGPALTRVRPGRGRAGPPSADGAGTGRRARSSPGPGKPAAWRRSPASPQRGSGTPGGRR
jgi:hypothetical protein